MVTRDIDDLYNKYMDLVDDIMEETRDRIGAVVEELTSQLDLIGGGTYDDDETEDN